MLPSRHKLRNELLDNTKAALENRLETLMADAHDAGGAIVSDGWDDVTNDGIACLIIVHAASTC